MEQSDGISRRNVLRHMILMPAIPMLLENNQDDQDMEVDEDIYRYIEEVIEPGNEIAGQLDSVFSQKPLDELHRIHDRLPVPPKTAEDHGQHLAILQTLQNRGLLRSGDSYGLWPDIWKKMEARTTSYRTAKLQSNRMTETHAVIGRMMGRLLEVKIEEERLSVSTPSSQQLAPPATEKRVDPQEACDNDIPAVASN